MVRAPVLLLLFVLVLFPAAAAAAQVPDALRQVVVFISVPGPAGKPMPNGTAFLMGVTNPNPPHNSYVYLVTAKHVLQEPGGRTFLPAVDAQLALKSGGVEARRIHLTPAGPKQNVFAHSDPAVDLAVIEFTPDPATHDFMMLPVDVVAQPEQFRELNIAEGTDVFFVGLFTPYVSSKKTSPIFRFGRIALIPDDKVEFTGVSRSLYLLETASFGGNSGAPVFTNLGADRSPGNLVAGPPIYKLLGVMMGAFLSSYPLVGPGGPKDAVALSNTGISAVTPARFVSELLHAPEVRRLRGY